MRRVINEAVIYRLLENLDNSCNVDQVKVATNVAVLVRSKYNVTDFF